MDYKISYRKKDGAIQCIINYKDGDEWKQRAKQGFKTQKDSKSWQDETLEELEKIVDIPQDFKGITFKKLRELFINDMKRELEYNTIYVYYKAFKKFTEIDPLIVTDITYIDIKPSIDKMIDEGLEESTIKIYTGKINTVFNHAIKKYKIKIDNPIKDITFKKDKTKSKKKVKALNKHELKDLLSKLSGEDYYISLIASKCGLRIGEIIGIVDKVFNFKDSELNVIEQWKEIEEGVWRLGTLKSTNSYRTVPIPKSCVIEIKNYVKTCVKDMNGRIFIDKSTKSVSTRLQLKYKRLGYDISVHDLRHTYATTLLSKGVDWETVAELMGDTVEIIIKTYSHVTDDMRSSAKKRIDKIL